MTIFRRDLVPLCRFYAERERINMKYSPRISTRKTLDCFVMKSLGAGVLLLIPNNCGVKGSLDATCIV